MIRTTMARWLVAAGFAALLAALSVPVPSQASPRSEGPIANATAFRGQGHLAFLWNGRLFILDGTTATLHAVTGVATGTSNEPITMAWSPDGRWLAYRWHSALWLVRADGSGAHQVQHLPTPVDTFSWNPAGTRLAAVTTTPSGHSQLWLVALSGAVQRLSLSPEELIWAPDGQHVAYTQRLPFRDPARRSDAFFTASLAGGRPVRRLVVPFSGIIPVRWWPNGQGVVLWVDPQNSASLAADGLPLYSLPLGGAPRLLIVTLTFPDWLAWSPSGSRVLAVSGGGRKVWTNKHLTICDISAATCQTLTQPQGTVAEDPAWSPAGNAIAFVRARDIGPVDTLVRPDSWTKTRILWIADAQGNHARQVSAAGTGIYQPQWSGDGRHLLYVRDNALWLVDTRGGAPVRILGPWPSPPDLYPFGYYGRLSWLDRFSWSRM